MSASFLVDLGNTCLQLPSIQQPALSGVIGSRSGALVGLGVDLHEGQGACNMQLTVLAEGPSLSGGGGELRVGVQTAPSDVSGQYTDPTSGMASMPGGFSSGGILVLNSGGGPFTSGQGGTFSAPVSGQMLLSGVTVASYFQRTGRFARAIMFGSGSFGGDLSVSFIEQRKLTGSGGGFAWSPQASGQVVNV